MKTSTLLIRNIKTLRKKLALNTNEFGKLIGVSGRTVEDWEQGRRVPSGPALKIMQQMIIERREMM